MKLKGLVALLVPALVACGGAALDVSPKSESGASAAAALGSQPVLLTFKSDWTHSLSGPLVAGGTVKVQYDTDRLPQCRGELNGGPAWAITGYYSLNGGPIGSFEAGGTAEPVFQVPAAGDLALWFQVTNRWGCSAWDSNYGNNHHVQVQVQPAVRFRADGSISVEGTPGAAPTLTIDYDLARLPHCRMTYNGYDSWEVAVEYRTDGGLIQQRPVTTIAGLRKVQAPAVLELPPGAGHVELWFKNWDRGSCVHYDSALGANYHFGLSR